ncbi:MAG: hypothetical protein COV34_01865 [Candidatus Zambryskibacteria bacterium CG10_big_fil_rev_8_21_14_0_10_42_12]|uniref:Excinuclease ABC subunit C n=1 Tax=Candidatus Zambryskibacteria bacterium CG10_big_fil_rev_8_21_14_0_10_42_12 TaxID=1975115 RepID=A0A2H0QVM8_9BACT|nr:MAG: hypothetical protein COV34_01865 [Candidatus Zambryskibacteria bacterium CG10_big_fil_rev_8_21_14_0_10_42_12]
MSPTCIDLYHFLFYCQYVHTAQFKKITANLPDTPGVYFFIGSPKQREGGSGKNLSTESSKILYIGKATSLKSRVKSYFASDLFERRGPKIVKMIEEAHDVTFEKTESALEAMILEAVLIKKHKPLYNTLGIDDKSYQYVVITDEEFPRVVLVRANDLMQAEMGAYELPYKIKKKFGPYPYGSSLKEALRIIRKIFPFRDEKAVIAHNERFYRTLGLSPNIDGAEAKKTYARTIRHIILFFEGKKKTLIKELEREMKSLAREQKFEEAERAKHTMFALTHIRDISLIKRDFYADETRTQTGFRIEAYDIAHTAGKDVVGVMTVLVDGEPDKGQYRKFNIKGGTGNNDVAALKEILNRRLERTEWPMPKLIVVDGGKPQMNAAEDVLEKAGVQIPVVCVTKDEFHRPRTIGGSKEVIKNQEDDIIFANAEAHRFALAFHKNKRGKIK